jgi:NTP pyrophosphatase (non-canonical NTP hydrolase)
MKLDFNEYQEKARSTAIYPNLGENYIYPTLGLSGEAGEISEKIKKVIRDEEGYITVEKRSELEKELGDVLWYVANLASELGLKLEDVAKVNLTKLFDRKDRGKIKGSGDNR